MPVILVYSFKHNFILMLYYVLYEQYEFLEYTDNANFSTLYDNEDVVKPGGCDAPEAQLAVSGKESSDVKQNEVGC